MEKKSNANFCTDIGKLTKDVVSGTIKIPTTPTPMIVPKLIAKYIGSDIAGQYAEKLCNTFTKNLGIVTTK